MSTTIAVPRFNKNVIDILHTQYAKVIFSDALKSLFTRLQASEKELLLKVTHLISKNPSIIKKSFFIYLCNGILSAKTSEELLNSKQQLFLELSLLALENRSASEIHHVNNQESCFSLFLNEPINCIFDTISFQEGIFIFGLKGREVKQLEKNKSCAITEDIFLMQEDHNPFNINNDHPEESFVRYDLARFSKEQWATQFKNAYRIIQEKTPILYQEIYSFLDSIVPHGYQEKKQLSSSYSKSPGILYLSYTDTDIKQAEAIIHETYHTIFNIISWKYKLLENDMELRYYSAYRPDARHLRGCLLGLHAFVAVQNFYAQLILQQEDEDSIETFMVFYLKNQKTISVIKNHGTLTKEGVFLFEDIQMRWEQDQHILKEFSKKYPSLFDRVEKEVEDHFQKAKETNDVLLY